MTDIDGWLSQLWKGEYLTEESFRLLHGKAKEVLAAEPNVVKVSLPVTICGDIHGQFPDLLELFRVGGRVPETNYVFLGDFVDRGVNGVEVFMLLVALKVKYPKRVTLLRGNHETRQISQTYGFYDECLKKFGNADIWKLCSELFDYLSLAAVVDNRILCVHGGISPDVKTIDDITQIKREREAPHEGAMCDLLWSDPEMEVDVWRPSNRGAGYLFGEKAILEFNERNKIDFVARAHQLVMEGYEWKFQDQLCTIWSAPNYCYRCGNRASVLELDDLGEKTFLLFDAAPENERTKDAHKASYKSFLTTFELD